MGNSILAVGRIISGEIHFQISPLANVTDAGLDSFLDEVYGRQAPTDEGARQYDLFDYDAEADDLAEARLDEEFWRSGQW